MSTDKPSNGNGNGSKEVDDKPAIKKTAKQELEEKIQELEEKTQSLEGFKFLEELSRHIDLVRGNASLLAKRIWERGESGDQEFAKKLMCNVGKHDETKFFGIEWDHLRPGNTNLDLLKQAHAQHVISNPHHPEHWGGMNSMPDIFLAEMVCDWKSRSDERGSDLRQWIKEFALSKYSISSKGKAYKKIKEYVDLLLDPLFSKIQ